MPTDVPATVCSVDDFSVTYSWPRFQAYRPKASTRSVWRRAGATGASDTVAASLRQFCALSYSEVLPRRPIRCPLLFFKKNTPQHSICGADGEVLLSAAEDIFMVIEKVVG